MPFVVRGRDYSGGDCWTVIYLAYRDVLGVSLPRYDDDYTSEDVKGSRALAELVGGQAHGGEWWQLGLTDPVNPLDVVVFNIFGRPLHVALVLDHRRMLHSEEKIGTMVEPMASPMWAKRREGIYRRVG